MSENRQSVLGYLRARWQSLQLQHQPQGSPLSYPAVLASNHLFPGAHVSLAPLLNMALALLIAGLIQVADSVTFESRHIKRNNYKRFSPVWFWLQGINVICFCVSLAGAIGESRSLTDAVL